MNEVINIEAKITDINKTFCVKIDTGKNRCTIYSKYDNTNFDYHLQTQSSLLKDLVNELKDVQVDGVIINGDKALELTRDGHFEDVVKGIIRSIGKKNLFLTITSLFSKLKNKLKVDISINKIIKLILSETVDLEKWEMEII